jgi:DNA repair protein RadA/Sms
VNRLGSSMMQTDGNAPGRAPMRRGLDGPHDEAAPAAGPLRRFGIVTESRGSRHDRHPAGRIRCRPVAKPAVQYACSECGYAAGRWFGKCPGCSSFGTLVEETVGQAGRPQTAPKPLLRLVDVEVEEAARIPTGVPELDRVLGGGLVPASLVLLGGEPGVGKSTVLLMALAAMSRARRVLLVTGEESAAQVKLRADRLGGAEAIHVLAETELDAVCETLRAERPDVCVIDSVQTLHAAELGSAPGSVAQVREAAGRLLRIAKESGVAIVLVGHVTKDGSVAGPRVLEHLVDCVLQFEGDRHHAHRVLRAAKNRFGSTNELGVFEMTGTGLVGVPDPSEVFGRTVEGEPGAAVACALEGTRPILLEIQALVAQSELAMPRRVATGVDPKRLAMIVAVLSRHAGVALGQADVFVNVAGGVRIDEPGADLAIALAIASAARRVPVRGGTAAFGEIGLTGRLRPAAQAERRLGECAKFGLVRAVVPAGSIVGEAVDTGPEDRSPSARGTGTRPHGKIRVESVETLRAAIRAGLEAASADGNGSERDERPEGRASAR